MNATAIKYRDFNLCLLLCALQFFGAYSPAQTTATLAPAAAARNDPVTTVSLEQARYRAIALLPFARGPQELEQLLSGGEIFSADPERLIRHGCEVNPLFTQRIAVTPPQARQLTNELAAFYGRFSHPPHADALWIVHRAQIADPSFCCLVTGADYVVAEDLLAKLGTFDFSPYRAVLYFPPEHEPHIFTIIQFLQRYAQGGGSIFLDMVTAGMTLPPEEKAQRAFFWHTFQLNNTPDPAKQTLVEFGTQKNVVSGTHPFLFYGETLALNPIPRGFASDNRGNLYPLTFEDDKGKGKWIFSNLPALFRPAARFPELSAAGLGYTDLLKIWVEYRQRFGALAAIVDQATSVTLDNYATLQQAQGAQVCCAWTQPGDPYLYRQEIIRFSAGADWQHAVAFEVTGKRLATGGIINVRAGMIEWVEDFPAGGNTAKLWVIKSAGLPVVLYADGTEKFPGKIDDGDYDAQKHVLKFSMAERAWVNSPTAPKSVSWRAIGDPQKTGVSKFEHDPLTFLLNVAGPGEPAEVRIEF